MTTIPAIRVDEETLAAFCKRWKVAEFAMFGSVMRDDFDDESDVDVMVSFEPGSDWSLWQFIDMQNELAVLFGRPVDLVQKGTIRNPFRLHSIERDLSVVYRS